MITNYICSFTGSEWTAEVIPKVEDMFHTLLSDIVQHRAQSINVAIDLLPLESANLG